MKTQSYIDKRMIGLKEMIIMFKSRNKRFIPGCLAFALVLASGPAYSQDTEIYFNSVNSAAIKPNVLFILDSSGSLNNTATGTGRSRLAILKEAMNIIVTSAEDINLGLMRFNGREGGSIIFPVSPIDSVVSDVVSEIEPTFTYSQILGSNDGVQRTTDNSVSLSEGILTVGNIPAVDPTGSIDVRVSDISDSVSEDVRTTDDTELILLANSGFSTVGVRFNSVDIPQGATITSATLELTSQSDQSGPNADFDIIGHDVDQSIGFELGSSADLASRSFSAGTTAVVGWNNHDDSPVNGTDVSPSIVSIIQEIINRPGWFRGNALSLILRSSNQERRWHSFAEDGQNNPDRLPRLQVAYTATPAAAIPTRVAIHFPTVRVPQGATVTDARLIFTAGANAGGPASWSIDAENIDDSPALTNSTGDIGGRTLTGNPVAVTSNPVNTPGQIPDPFNVNDNFFSPDLSSVMQTVVNRSGWCGSNGMTFVISGTGTRHLYSYDSSAQFAPRLQVNYSGAQGCTRGTETAQIASGSDDTEGSYTIGGLLQLFPSADDVGLRFQNIDVPRGATIMNATLSFSARLRSNSTANSAFSIRGELSPDPAVFGNIIGRTLTSASVAWNTTRWLNNRIYTSSDLAAIVQEIVNQNGWNSGNSMVFAVDTTAGVQFAISYDNNSFLAPRLSITYESGGSVAIPRKIVRDRVLELVDALPASDFTPITEVLYEAARYWRGERVEYGLARRDTSTFFNSRTRISHPGSYCNEPTSGAVNCNGADTAAHPPYGVDAPAMCTSNLDSRVCSSRRITGTPNYVSPFSSALTCAQNYQVLLTDGDANSNDIASLIPAEYLAGTNNTTCRTSKSDGTAVTTGELCGIDLVEFLFDEDQSSTLANDQTVITHTVGFDTTAPSLTGAVRFLRDVATEGGGQFFEGTSVDSLVTVFQSILADVKDGATSIVSPSLATNAFNRLFSRDEVYFGLFTPELTAAWDGNVKKYTVCTEVNSLPNCDFVTRILDANGVQAVDTQDRFRTTSQSFWSDVVDGIETTRGGTGGELTDFNDRLIYTETTAAGTAPASGTALDANGFNITSTNWNHATLAAVRDLVCPVPSTATGSACEDRMLFMLGKVIRPRGNDVNTTTRWTINDVLHSSPVTITYGGADTSTPPDGIVDSFYDKLIYGTNDGGLRMVNATTGKEDWMFVPRSTMALQQTMWRDPEGAHTYGIDSTPVVMINDVDSDGVVEPGDGDTVHAYFGMRRGGNFLYALDLTATAISSASTVVPKFLWRIEGGVTGSDFQYLADTWSVPERSRILTNDTVQLDVLIFGGGYDTALDSGFGVDATSGSENNGNIIFVVNPADGSLIFSIGGSNTNATLTVPDMRYSFAARPTVVDTTGDGVDNRIYIADTGGQIWRVDLAANINPAFTGASRAGESVVARLADIATESGTSPTPVTLESERRFFEKPEVAAVSDTIFTEAGKSRYFLVTLGSGDRANPLATTTRDRFYAFRDFEIGTMTRGSGTNAHIAQGYPRISGLPLDESAMIDATLGVLDGNSTAVDQSFGWYIDFTSDGHTGEKVFSSPLIVSGNVFFTTYEPTGGTSRDLCSASVGGGRLIGVNVTTAAGFVTDDVAGRTISDTLSGLASAVIPFYSPEGIYGLVGVEGGVWQAPPSTDPNCTGPLCDGGLKLGDNFGILTYWSEE